MAGCKTWRGKLTWSFPFERVATLGERREKEREGGACMKDLKKQKHNALCGAGRGQSPRAVTSVYALLGQRRTKKSAQSDPLKNRILDFSPQS